MTTAFEDAPIWVRRPWVWRLVALGFTGFLVVSGVGVLTSERGAAAKVLTLALLLAYGGVFLSHQVGEPGADGPRRWAVLAGLGVAVVAVLGPGSIGQLMFVLVTAATVFPRRRATVITAVTCAGMLVYTGLAGDGPHWAEVSVYGSITMMMVVLMSLRTAIVALRAANDEVARLAVAEERNRLARDLHDVLGHSLTTITVKAALARRLTEAGDAERAAAEIADVEVLTRSTLTDLRATVSAQRTASLPAELAGSRAALTAAGIEAVLPQATDDVAEDYREAFAHVLREGVTNVVRHSGARRCEVRLGARWVEVRDDGPGPASQDGAGPTGGGTGLTGLRERLAPLGAELHAGPAPDGGFLLRAEATREPARPATVPV